MLLCRYRAAINHSTGHSRAAGLLRVFSGEGVEARNFASKHLTSASARGKLRTAFCSTLLPCEETPSSGGTGRVWSQPARKFGYPQTRPYTSTASDSRFAFTLEHLHHNNPALILSLIRKSLLDEATLLSLSPPTSSTSLPPTPLSCLMCLYVTLKESYPAQLQFLSNAELSSLISLFGSASLTDSKAFSCIHANSPAALHPFASTLPRTVYSSHWDMVTEIGRDKEVMFGRKLNHSDHYWLMRAAIHKESTERPSLSVAESHLYFANARRHYYPIRSRLYPEIHIPYIRALLSCPPSAKRPATEALLRTCSILRESWTDSDLQTCFWESVRRVSGFDRSQTRAVREEALRCLGRKIRKKEITTPWKISPSRPGCYTAKSRNRSPGDISSRSDGPLARPPQTTPVTIHELHSLLCAELLCTPSHLSQVNPWLASWALLHLRSEFPGPDRRQPGVERAWRALALLSLGRREPKRPQAGETDAQIPTARTRMRRWKEAGLKGHVELIAGLVALVNKCEEMHRAGTTQHSPLVWKLWQTWMTQRTELAGSQGSCEVERAIVLCFAQIAQYTRDDEFYRELHGFFLNSQGTATFPFQQRGKPKADIPAAAQLAVTQIACSDVDAGNWLGIVEGLQCLRLLTPTTSIDNLSRFTEKVVSELLTSRQPRLAHEFYVGGHAAVGVSLSSPVLIDLFRECALAGRADLAIAGLAKLDVVDLTVALKKGALGDIVFALRQIPAEERESVVDVWSGLLLRILQQRDVDSHLDLRFWERSIILLAADGRGPLVIQFFADLLRPSTPQPQFSGRFLVGVVRKLCLRRHFKLAARFVHMIPPTHPNRLVVHRLLFHYLASAGARTLARTVWEEVRQAGHKPTTRESLLLLDIKIGRLKRKRVSPSAVKALMRKEPKAGVQRLYSLALRLLARGGQSYGVNKFTRRFSPRTSSAFNTLLHSRLASSRSKRNARQVKAVFAKLNALISEKFIPDRVTVNVLLKCLLRWPAVTSSTKLRLLFDQLVSSGYPGVVPGETAPFGTQWEATPSQLGLLRPMLTGEVSFRRHAKPMYLMFIKAFYLRGDRSAAKKVIGILKAAELEEKERDVAEAAARRRTRTQGRAGGSLGVLPSDIEC